MAGRPRGDGADLVPRHRVRRAGAARGRRGRVRPGRGADAGLAAGAAGGRLGPGAGAGGSRRRAGPPGDRDLHPVRRGRCAVDSARGRVPRLRRGGDRVRLRDLAARRRRNPRRRRALRPPGGRGLRVRSRLPRSAGVVAAWRGVLRRGRPARHRAGGGGRVRHPPGPARRGPARRRCDVVGRPEQAPVPVAGRVARCLGRVRGAGPPGGGGRGRVVPRRGRRRGRGRRVG